MMCFFTSLSQITLGLIKKSFFYINMLSNGNINNFTFFIYIV